MVDEAPFARCTDGITVSVSLCYVEGPLVKATRSHTFRMDISIRNDRDDGVQLLERHVWASCDGVGYHEEVGPGVVGLQPFIEPGRTFDYAWRTDMWGIRGTATGYYTFHRATANGRRLVAHIPVVDLVPDCWLQ